MESYLRRILVHLIKLDAVPEAPSAGNWRAEIVTFHNDVLARVTPGMVQNIDLDKTWRRAKREAAAALAAHGDALPDGLPSQAPVRLMTLLREDLDIDAVLHDLRQARSTARPNP